MIRLLKPKTGPEIGEGHKKIILAIIAISFILVSISQVNAQDEATVSAGRIEVEPGAKTNTQILVENVEDFGIITVELGYDTSVVNLTTFEKGNISGIFNSNLDKPNGTIRILFWTTERRDGDFVLANLTMQVSENWGERSQLDLTLEEFSDFDNNPIPVDVDDGYVQIRAIPSITNLHHKMGNFWVNWSWENPSHPDFKQTMVYVNGDFHTTTTEEHFNMSCDPHGTYTISTRTVDSTGNINRTWINQTATIPNNPPVMSPMDNITVEEGETIFVDADASDVDGDSLTYYCSRKYAPAGRGFSDFDSSTGRGNWTTQSGDDGVYHVDFRVWDYHGGADEITVKITVEDAVLDVSVHNSGYTYINWTWEKPVDSFDYFKAYLNGQSMIIDDKVQFYNATRLQPGTEYTLSLQKIRYGTPLGNWINHTAITDSYSPPQIESHTPQSPVKDYEGASRQFEVKYDQSVDVTWLINDSKVQHDQGVKQPAYTNQSAVEGTWNVTAVAENVNGSVTHHWIWEVTGEDTTNHTNDTNDTTLPLPPSVTNVDNETGVNWINWTWEWENPVSDFSHVMIYVDGEFYTNTSNQYCNLSFGPGETHSISIKTVDTGGNINPNGVNDTATTKKPPQTQVFIHSPQETVYKDKDIPLKVSASTQIDKWLYRLNNGENTTFTPNTTINVGQGVHCLEIYAVSESDETVKKEIEFTVDTTPPVLSWKSTPANNSELNTATFTLNISHSEPNPLTLTLYLNGEKYRDLSYGGNFTQIDMELSEGEYSYYVEANDTAGHSNTTGVRTVLIDTPPSIDLEAPSTAYANSKPSLTINSDEPLANATLTINGHSYSMVKGESLQWSYNWMPPNSTSYSYHITAYDLTGNSHTVAGEIKVLPLPQLEVKQVLVSANESGYVYVNHTVNITSLIVNNQGTAKNIDVKLTIDDYEDTKTIEGLEDNKTETVQFTWTPSDAGNYTVTIDAVLSIGLSGSNNTSLRVYTTSNMGKDTDNDGWTDQEEKELGTDPHDGEDKPTKQHIIDKITSEAQKYFKLSDSEERQEVMENIAHWVETYYNVSEESQKPSPDFSYSPSSPEAGDTVNFKDESHDPHGQIIAWLWSFGDGGSSSSRNVTHHYSSEGTYNVNLTVIDKSGDMISATKHIEVSPKESGGYSSSGGGGGGGGFILTSSTTETPSTSVPTPTPTKTTTSVKKVWSGSQYAHKQGTTPNPPETETSDGTPATANSSGNQPETGTESETGTEGSGFEVIVAIGGLLTVAYLIRKGRR